MGCRCRCSGGEALSSVHTRTSGNLPNTNPPLMGPQKGGFLKLGVIYLFLGLFWFVCGGFQKLALYG